jgi:hypothetical protein
MESRIYVSYKLSSPRISALEKLKIYFRSYEFALLDLAESEVLDELSDGPSHDGFGAMYETIMRIKAEKYGKTRYGDKSPAHIVCLKEIFRYHPKAKVIFIVRDPRALIYSALHMPFMSHSIWVNSVLYSSLCKRVERFSDKILEVKLEELIDHPRLVLERVLAYVGEPWDEAVLDHPKYAPDDLPNFPFYRKANRVIQGNGRVPLWQRHFSPEWIRMIEAITKRGMERYGYLPAELDREPGYWARLTAVLSDFPKILYYLSKSLEYAWRYRWQAFKSPWEQFELNLRFNPDTCEEYADAGLLPLCCSNCSPSRRFGRNSGSKEHSDV